MATRRHWKTPHDPGLIALTQLLLWAKADGAVPRWFAKRGGTWTSLTATEIYQRSRAVAAGLAGLGVEPGERVAILSESRPEWLLADLGCLAAGAVDVPIYPTLTMEQTAYILRDAGAVGAFCSSREQLEKLQAAQGRAPALRWVCAFEGGGEVDWVALTGTAPGEPEAAFDARLAAVTGDTLATILYTSGTTGEPKGVRLTHGNLCAALNTSSLDFSFTDDERRLSILPLSHVTERHVAYVDMMYSAETWFAESMDTVAANLIEVRPTYLVAVPRLFEKIAAAVREQANSGSRARRAIFFWAQRVGAELAPYRLEGREPPRGLRWKAGIADRLVWHKLRAKMGGRLNKILAGGAALGLELSVFLLSLGVTVDEGYGLTETSAVLALNRPGGRRPGSVGRPLSNVAVRFADDGELLVRGPAIFGGYYQMPEATAAALDADDWFHTGDIGRQDEDGFLYITDRKSDLIKTSNGKFIAPQPIEAKLKACSCIAEAVVVGDRRNYAAVLLVPNWSALQARGFEVGDREHACEDMEIRELFEKEVALVNATLARFETLKRFALIPAEFTVASGELTPTIKVRRRAVEQHYAALIESLYQGNVSAP